jgi:hypothetical protein
MLLEASVVLEAEDLTVELGAAPGVTRRGYRPYALGRRSLCWAATARESPPWCVRCSACCLTSGGWCGLFGFPVARFPELVADRLRATTVGWRCWAGSKVKEVVAAGRLARRRPFRPLSRADRDAIRQAIGQVGLSEQLNDDIAGLSGGQQQRA